MQRREQFLQGLLELHTLRDPGSRRAAWRASVASVARACSEDLPSPLDGLSPQAVADSVRTALGTGLIDDLDWLSSSSAGAALYEIAAALPAGNEKRELGRRVLARLLEGDADSFVALATRMALGSGKGLGGEGVRARVALAAALPAVHGVPVDPLALALLSRRELAREWVSQPASGSLPDRRMAARLIEQAARAIARRVSQGDDRALSVLKAEAVARASERLLEDREPLVWRHIAIARGLLAPYVPAYHDAIERGFSPDLSPTEWRRAAASLGALAASRPDEALRRLREALSRGLLKRDPGATAALLWGLPAAAEVEPEAAEEMLTAVVEAAPLLLASEALPEVLAAGPGGSFGKHAAARLREALAHAPPPSAAGTDEIDDGAVALRAHVLAELGAPGERQRSILDAARDGLRAFAEQGAKQAFVAGLEALELAKGHLAALQALEEPEGQGKLAALARRASFSALRELDAGLLEDGLVHDLLVLGLRSPEAQKAIEEAAEINEQIAAYVGEREQVPLSRTGPLPHRTLRFHRLRLLLHLADVRVDSDRDEGRAAILARARNLRLANLMLRHLVSGPPPALHRMICAAFARAVDALLRDESCDAADVLLWVAQRGLSTADVETLVEASMNPDLRPLMRAYGRMLRSLDDSEAPARSLSEPPESLPPGSLLPPRPSSIPPLGDGLAARKVEALAQLSRQIEVDSSSRIEALRTAVRRVARGLARVLASRSLVEVAGASGAPGAAEASPARELEGALASLAQLCSGARQRMGDRAHESLLGSFPLSLASAVDAAAGGSDGEGLTFAVASAREELSIVLPPVMVDVVCEVLDTLLSLPVMASVRPPPPDAAPEAPLPAWLPRRRTLGGFYVVRALGSGTGGTVFMARRIEDRHDESAERFALKVPDYDGNAARALSEEQFLQLFREEATALLGLPAHQNLARFVTFDLASRPKPILVMELVEGMSLERAIRSCAVDIGRGLEVLDGVLAGLAAMHSAGIGHLDIKPSNVILRSATQPVLVDFGLSGRHIRPGCATLPYGAPEIWGGGPDEHEPEPWAADMYAFACLAFELLTSHELFDAPTELALVTNHLSHDGWPERLGELSERPEAAPLCEALSQCLRHDPRDRASAELTRALLREAAGPLAGVSWPLTPPRKA